MKTSDTPVQPSMKRNLTFKLFAIDVLLFFTILGAIYLMLSLISFSSADPGWSQTAWYEPIHNLGGEVGAYLSDVLLQFLGFVSYAIPLLIIIFVLQIRKNLYTHFEQHINYFSLSFRIIGVLAFLFCAAGYLSLNIQDLDQLQSGGIIGDIVAEEMLSLTDHFSATLILLTISFASITLLTGLSWLSIADIIGALIVYLTTPLFVLILQKFKPSKAKNSVTTNYHNQSDFAIELDDNTRCERKSIIDDEPIPFAADAQKNEFNSMDMDYDDLVTHSEELTNFINKNEHEAMIAQQTTIPSLNHDERYMALIDENNPPPHFSLSEDHNHSSEFSINPDYYSPLVTIDSAENTNTQPISSATKSTLPIDLERFVMPKEPSNEAYSIKPHAESKEIVIDMPTEEHERIATNPSKTNLHDSLIHPLLQKDTKPLVKPTTPLPSLDLLTAPPVKQIEVDHNALKMTAALLEKSLADFRVKARVVGYLPGPVITRFEIELAPGVKASRISTLDRDLARSLSMPSVRVVEVIPGKPYVGIELPNKHRQTVYFREVLDSPQFKDAQSPLTVVLGKDIAGQSVVADLTKMPHLLVAGTTGSGKSVGVNAMILSILYKSQPADAKFIMIDPKMLELSVYQGIPHLLTDVVTDMKDAANALNWCVNEMEKRYRLMSALGVRNITGYNDKIKQAEEMGRPIPDPLWKPTDSMDIEMPTLEKLPYIVVMVDEFADLIMAVGKKVEELIARLAQKARAAGIHLVLATQRPSVDVITGLIKANIPTRIAFTVSSKIDSRTILDQMGAESLLGMGDMLYLAPNSSIPIRVHGAFVRDEEVHSVVQDWKARGIPAKYIENITAGGDDGDGNSFDNNDEELDPLFDQVVDFVVEKRRASISSVQRQFRIGYNRAARIVEQMEVQGIVSAPSHNGNREVLAQPTNFD